MEIILKLQGYKYLHNTLNDFELFASLPSDPLKFEAKQDNFHSLSAREIMKYLLLFVTSSLFGRESKYVILPSPILISCFNQLIVERGRPGEVMHTTGSGVFSITDRTLFPAGSIYTYSVFTEKIT